MKTLLLYTTSGCHLCETAEKLMLPALEAHGFQLQKVEISDADELVERYGMRIPVIRRPEREDDLGWPFSEAAFLDYLLKDV